MTNQKKTDYICISKESEGSAPDTLDETLPENGNDRMKEMIQENYNRIKSEVKQIVADELQRIQNDPALAHLLRQK